MKRMATIEMSETDVEAIEEIAPHNIRLPEQDIRLPEQKDRSSTLTVFCGRTTWSSSRKIYNDTVSQCIFGMMVCCCKGKRPAADRGYCALRPWRRYRGIVFAVSCKTLYNLSDETKLEVRTFISLLLVRDASVGLRNTMARFLQYFRQKRILAKHDACTRCIPRPIRCS